MSSVDVEEKQPPKPEPPRKNKIKKNENIKRWYCQDENDASYACLSRNDYDYDKCEAYFEAFRNCKKEMNDIKWERRRRGLPPHDIPPKGQDPYT